ncbi:HAL/PAL/TAL family ammonia-lyase [Acidisoma silvae]|uniref:Aromatic amino acid lyase n=1 Tax=Acidisoma silvae TaxID=2802396 RepID=A0A964E0D6_9PROT|nr:aromatic amino acid lyase [Acidisoma silvae]MCB8877052.1 aromatic amino acid lyase [Acidisoma silvae]
MTRPLPAVPLGRSPLTVADVAAVAHGAPVTIDAAALTGMRALNALVRQAVESGQPIYGLTTGVGDLYTVALKPEELAAAQMNLLRSHASGVGAAMDVPAVRATMLVLMAAFLKAASGVSPGLVETMAAMLNRGVTPWSPSGGSVGYLIATAHIGLAIFGESQAYYEGVLLPAADALSRAGISAIAPGAREGHALISNTCEITALGALALARVQALLPLADLAGAMSTEAMRGNLRGYDARLHQLRPHPGQTETAAHLRALLAESAIIAAHRDHRLQDPLSLRCIPQVHGAVRDALAHAIRVVEIELDSVTDNPVFFIEDGALAALSGGGNGHGMPTALALDHLSTAIAALSSISQARSDRLTNQHLSGLPAFLGDGSGAHSGFMIPPYVAAALSADNRMLAAPASVHSLSTCAGQEDHISMGVAAARKARQAAENLADILSIELLCAADGLEFHAPRAPGRGTGAGHAVIRTAIARRTTDRPMQPDLAAMRILMDSGDLAATVAQSLPSYWGA